MDKSLKTFLKKSIVKKKISDKLGVIDSKLGGVIKEKLGIECISGNVVNELTRGLRNQLSSLLSEINEGDFKAMVLGLSHSLSRYKIKFSPDKVDTMIIQAIGKFFFFLFFFFFFSFFFFFWDINQVFICYCTNLFLFFY